MSTQYMKQLEATFKATIAACQQQGLIIQYPEPKYIGFCLYRKAKALGRQEAAEKAARKANR